jgi:thiosulfate/3-mercaptopyruvate sulfurtransferase
MDDSGVLLTVSELVRSMASDTVVVIDTRDPQTYRAGHIPGAVNVHEVFTYLATSTPQGLAALRSTFAEAFGAAGVSGSETVVFYEQSMTGGFGQSCRGYLLLTSLGHPAVRVLHGGFSAWLASSLPVSTDVPSPVAASLRVDGASASLIVDTATVVAALRDPRVVILDVRDVDEWIGESSSPYGADFCPRKGRIPGARWLEWYRLMKPMPQGPMFKRPKEILAECQTVGIGTDTPVVVYCFKGARAANTLVALKEAGVKDVRVYFGSWNEWSRDPRLPIDAGFPGEHATVAMPPVVVPSCLRPIDDAGLRRLIATGRANPGDIKTAKCRTVADGQFRNLSYCRDHAPYVVDEPEPMLGRNTGPSPAETALASLGACLSVGVQANATARGITLHTLELTLEARYPNTFVWGAGDLSQVNAGFTAVDIAVTIDGDASPDALDALIAHAVAWSPIAGTMRNPVALAVTRVPR